MATSSGRSVESLAAAELDDVYAVCSGGVILHFDGTLWHAMQSPTVNDLHGIWGAASDDIFAVGRYGTILHYGP